MNHVLHKLSVTVGHVRWKRTPGTIWSCSLSLKVDKMIIGNIFLRYQKAIEIYEDIGRQSLNNNLLKYGVKGHLLNAGICQLCKGDVVAINNALERYQVYLFQGTQTQLSCYILCADAVNLFSLFVGFGSNIFGNTRVQIAGSMSFSSSIDYVYLCFILFFSMFGWL